MSSPVGSHFFRLTPDDVEDVRRLTLAGKTASYIAEYIGCSKTTVHNYVRRLGIKPRVFRSNCYTDDQLQEMIVMYNLGIRASKIASHFGRSKEAIYAMIGKLRAKGLIPPRFTHRNNEKDSLGNEPMYRLRVQPMPNNAVRLHATP